MSTQQFAFGVNHYGDCECPALAAGVEPNGDNPAGFVASRYDYEVEGKESRGVISEEEARAAWNRMVAKLRKEADEKGLHEELGVAEDVREELGWS